MRQRYILYLILIAILITGINCKSVEPAKNESQKSNIEAAFQACEIGDLNRLKKLVPKEVDVNTEDEDQFTLLHQAAMNGNLDIVKFLVANGADIHAIDFKDETPLIDVIKSYINYRNIKNKNSYIKIIEFLISNGADSNLLEILKSDTMGSPVGVSNGNDVRRNSQAEIVKLLIDNGGDINEKDVNGITPLIMALKNENNGVIELLISRGADTNVLNNWDKTEALEFAASGGYKNIVELLVNHGANIGNKDKYEYTPLHSAAASGSKETVEYLLSKGADINARNNFGDMPLSIAIQVSQTGRYLPEAQDNVSYCNRGTSFYWWDEFDRAIEDYTTAIELDPNDGSAYCLRGRALFKKGETQKAKEDWKKSIQINWSNAFTLYRSFDFLDDEMVHLLKETTFNHFQDISMVTGNYVGYGGGPGDFYTVSLILSNPFNEELFLNMLKNDKPVVRAMGIICLARENLSKYEDNIRSLYNDTTSVYYMPIYDMGGSIKIGELAQKIVEEPKMLDYWSPEVAKRLYEMDSQSNYNKKDYSEAIKFLIEQGAEVNPKDNSSESPLHLAAALKNTNIADMLISHGAKINAQNQSGETPLRIATYWGNADMIEFLIEKGADINIKDNKGRTPLKLAIEMDYYGIADLLRQHGAAK